MPEPIGGTRVLVLQHVPWEGLGLLSLPMREGGVRTTFLRFYGKKPAAPRRLDLRQYDALVALGSPSTAYEPSTNPYHDYEVELFARAREEKLPSFDICYSMQMFATANGGTVGRNPNGKEVGFYDLTTTPAANGDLLFRGIRTMRTLEWHGDCVTQLPKGSVLLASSEKTANQVAVVDGLHYLLQSDGQAAQTAMLKEWLRRDRAWALDGTGVDVKLMLSEAARRGQYFRETCRRTFVRFLALAEREKARRRRG